MKKKIFKIIKKIGEHFLGDVLHILKIRESKTIINEFTSKYPNSLIKYSFSIYSQNLEDGIINEIFKRLKISTPTFVEFGVSPTENNTLNLLLNEGKGVWVDATLKKYKTQLSPVKNLHIIDKWITKNNIINIIKEAQSFLNILDSNDIDMISMDLDGNDYYFIKTILKSGVTPKLFCLEYNAKFPPKQKICIKYNINNVWEQDDYMGCSLQSYIELLKKFNYTLITCDIYGINSFFIRNDLVENFHIYNPEILYQPPRYFLSPSYKGHNSTLKHLLNLSSTNNQNDI
tara:strand:- start:435 stop:1298 length:864 start_codon:yes stop_codon:yes gene_type:complete